MALDPNDSKNLALLTEEVGQLANTVDELLEMVKNSGGQGGDIAAGIAGHNNSATVHAALRAKIGVVTEITASRNFSAEAGVKYLVEVWAGGGPGGFAIGADGAYTAVAGGGSSGGYVSAVIGFAQSENVPVAIGAGGTSVVGNNTPGGDSSFGSYLTAKGGLSGMSASNSAGQVRSTGGGASSGSGSNPGLSAVLFNVSTLSGSNGGSGHGGPSAAGQPGASVSAGPSLAGSNGRNAVGRNAGGSGAAAFGNNSYAGGNGAPGLVRITRIA